MTPEEAKNVIWLHTQPVDPPDTHSFLGSLRPFQGVLDERNFLELMEAIRALEPVFREQDSVEREVVSNLWCICYASRLWGIDPGGMLQRNHLISADDTRILDDWTNRLSEAVLWLLGGGGNVEDAMIEYVPLVERRNRNSEEHRSVKLETDKIDNAVLALLFLGRHDGDRVWKGFDWDAMDRLHEKGYITDPKGKAKSVCLTDEGLARAQRLLEELFAKQP